MPGASAWIWWRSIKRSLATTCLAGVSWNTGAGGLMGELVKDQVVSIARVRRSSMHGVPCQHNRTGIPSLAQPAVVPLFYPGYFTRGVVNRCFEIFGVVFRPISGLIARNSPPAALRRQNERFSPVSVHTFWAHPELFGCCCGMSTLLFSPFARRWP